MVGAASVFLPISARGHRGVPGGRVRRQGGAGGRGQPARLRPGPGGGGGGREPICRRWSPRPGREGREALLETEAYALVQALGIGVPPYLVVSSGWAGPVPGCPARGAGGGEGAGPGGGPQDRSGRGAGRAARPGGRGGRHRRHGPATSRARRCAGWLVAEFVPHDDRPGGELLLGVRRTAEFGPVLLLGLGGLHGRVAGPGAAPRACCGCLRAAAAWPLAGRRRWRRSPAGCGAAPRPWRRTTWRRCVRRVAEGLARPARRGRRGGVQPSGAHSGGAGGPRRPGPPGRCRRRRRRRAPGGAGGSPAPSPLDRRRRGLRADEPGPGDPAQHPGRRVPAGRGDGGEARGGGDRRLPGACPAIAALPGQGGPPRAEPRPPRPPRRRWRRWWPGGRPGR